MPSKSKTGTFLIKKGGSVAHRSAHLLTDIRVIGCNLSSALQSKNGENFDTKMKTIKKKEV